MEIFGFDLSETFLGLWALAWIIGGIGIFVMLKSINESTGTHIVTQVIWPVLCFIILWALAEK